MTTEGTREVDGSQINPLIDVERIFADLQLTEADLRLIDALEIPEAIRVCSTSGLKVGTVSDVLRIVQPGRHFTVIGVKAPSKVGEGPIGKLVVDGSLNRLDNGTTLREQVAAGEQITSAWFSPESGLFEERPSDLPDPVMPQGVILHSEGANLSTAFNPAAEYEDRVVTAVRVPGRPTVVQISPRSEAIRFPRAAVVAAYEAEGSFATTTAGSKLREMGFIKDGNNPQLELTARRPGGPLSRQDQMARTMIRALVKMAKM